MNRKTGSLVWCSGAIAVLLAFAPGVLAQRAVGPLAAGTILLSASSVCNNDRGRMADMQLQLYTSTDGGRTWQYCSTVAEGTAEVPVWEPHLHILDDGSLVTYYSSEAHKADGYNQLLCHKASKDQGKTWGPEVYDVAFPGGVERPGMTTVARLPDRRYVLTYEAVDGPVQSQVYMKYSRDGLDFGGPTVCGTPIQTQAGQYLVNCPVVSWFPLGGPSGVLIVSARGAAGGGDTGGRSLYWNTNNGVGPWWEVPAPVQKRPNSRAGWTQALMLKRDFNRYAAENAARRGASQLRDRSMSNGTKVRLAAKDLGRLTFQIYVPSAGGYTLAVNYEDIGFAATPRLIANGAAVSGAVAAVQLDDATAGLRARDLGTRSTGKRMVISGRAELRAGENIIEVAGGEYALDVDFLQVTP